MKMKEMTKMGQSVKVTKDSTDEFIDPATEDLQRDLLQEFAKNSKRATNDLKFQNITCAPANTAVAPGTAHGCTSVQVMTAATTVYIDDVSGDVTQKPVLLIQNIWLEIPINNVGNLRFLGTAGTEVVYMISSN